MPQRILSVGLCDEFTGFVTKALFLRGQSTTELELRLGYGAGRLASGYWLLFALEVPEPEQFEFAGYTHFSGGRPQGHLDNRNPTSEQSLAATGHLLAHKNRVINDVFRVAGPERLAKVIPLNGGDEYPQGKGIPQWKIVPTARRQRGITFRVVEQISAGGIYKGNYA